MRPRLVQTYLVVAASGLSLSACGIGLEAGDVRPATSPNGVLTRVRFADEASHHQAELLDVREDGLLLDLPGGILLARWESMDEVEFVRAPGVDDLEDGRRPSSLEMDRLRLLSRYAFGLSAEHLDRLLDSRGQSELQVRSP